MSELDRRAFLRIGVLSSLGFALARCAPAPSPAEPRPTSTTSRDRALAPVDLEGLLVFRPDAARYDELRTRFNLRTTKRPAVIVLCRTRSDVARAVRYAKQEGLPVAVKSGGHSFEGFSSNDGGLVVDLSLLSDVTWIDDETVRVGPACTLAELYAALLPRGRIVPAGSCGGVGVGGLTLGGGYGLFSRRLGLTCDSLLGVTLVDGTGRVRDSRDDAELLWACKGGGNGNFGAVTELRFRTHTAPPHLTSHRFKAFDLEPARAASLLETWFGAAARLPRTSFSAFVLNGRTLTVLVTDTAAPTEALSSVLAELERVTDKATRGRPEELAQAVRRYEGIRTPIHFKNASAGFYDGFDDLRPVARELCARVGAKPRLIFQVNTLGGLVAHPQFAAASAFPHRDAPFLGELQAYYDRPEQAAAHVAAFRAVQKLLRDAGVRRHYRNYPDADFADALPAYYGDHLARLRRVKHRLDPDDVFRHPQSVPAP